MDPRSSQWMPVATARPSVPGTERLGTAFRGNVADLELEQRTSTDKALALLTAFSVKNPVMGVSDIARLTGLPKSTSHRLLATLVRWGLVVKEDKLYSPGFKLMELASVSQSRRLQDAAMPSLLDLYEMTHETVHLGVLDKDDVVYVEKIYGRSSATTPTRVGGRFPASCSAIGKAMLAFDASEDIHESGPLRCLTSASIADPRRLDAELERIRSNRIAFDQQESAVGLTCVAAPIIGPSRQLLGAISVSGPVQRFRPAAISRAVHHAAAEVAQQYAKAS